MCVHNFQSCILEHERKETKKIIHDLIIHGIYAHVIPLFYSYVFDVCKLLNLLHTRKDIHVEWIKWMFINLTNYSNLIFIFYSTSLNHGYIKLGFIYNDRFKFPKICLTYAQSKKKLWRNYIAWQYDINLTEKEKSFSSKIWYSWQNVDLISICPLNSLLLRFIL